MTNIDLRNFAYSLFFWGQYNAITKKVGLELEDRVWFKLEQPVAGQLLNPIIFPIPKAIQKQK